MLNSTLRTRPGFYMLCSLYVAYYICVYKKAEELMIRKEPHPDITLLLHNASGKLSLILFLFNGGKNCHMKNLKKKKDFTQNRLQLRNTGFIFPSLWTLRSII